MLVVGSNLRKEVPLIAHRVRQGAVRRGAKVAFINPRAYDVRFPVTAQPDQQRARHGAAPGGRARRVAAAAQGKAVPSNVRSRARRRHADRAQHEAVAATLAAGDLRVILLGALAQHHAAYSELRALAAALADATGAQLGYLPEGGNAVGAALAGALAASRRRAVVPSPRPGSTPSRCSRRGCKAYVLVGGIESADLVPSSAIEAALRGAECVVAITPYASEEILANASVILPSRGVRRNLGHLGQRRRALAERRRALPSRRAKRGPRWKVLRVLGNLLGLAGFEYVSSEEVRDELRRELDDVHGRRDRGRGVRAGSRSRRWT